MTEPEDPARQTVYNRLSGLNNPTYPDPVADALAVEAVFLNIGRLVLVADLCGQGVFPHPVEALLQAADLLRFQQNLPLEILTRRGETKPQNHPSRPGVNPGSDGL